MPTITIPQRKKKAPFTKYGYTVVVERIPEGGYSVIVPAVPQVQGFGRTRDQAIENVKQELRRFIKVATDMGERIPSDLRPATARVAIVVSVQ